MGDNDPIPYPPSPNDPPEEKGPQLKLSTATASDGISPAQPVRTALIPAKYAAVVGLVALVATAASGFIAPPWGGLVAILGFLAAALAGVAAPQPKWVAGKPIVSGAAVTAFGGAVPVVATLSDALPEGAPKLAASVLALALAWAAGLSAPTPTRKT